MARTNARDTGLPCVHYVRRSFTISDSAKEGGKILIGTLPANSYITAGILKIDAPWNAGTSSYIAIGQDVTPFVKWGGGDIDASTVSAPTVMTGVGMSAAADVDIVAVYNQTGTPATTGQATVLVTYVPNR